MQPGTTGTLQGPCAPTLGQRCQHRPAVNAVLLNQAGSLGIVRGAHKGFLCWDPLCGPSVDGLLWGDRKLEERQLISGIIGLKKEWVTLVHDKGG